MLKNYGLILGNDAAGYVNNIYTNSKPIVSRSETGRLALYNGPFDDAKWAVSQCKMIWIVSC